MPRERPFPSSPEEALDLLRADIYAHRRMQAEIQARWAIEMAAAQEAEEAATLRYFAAVERVYGYGTSTVAA